MATQKSTIGRLGEDFAERYFLKKGFSVKRNFHSRFGEIDLIAENEDTVIFVEVKTRSSASLTTPAEAVDYYKQRKIIKTAEFYMMKAECEKQPRFDIFEVFQEKGRIFSFNHIESAFDAQ